MKMKFVVEAIRHTEMSADQKTVDVTFVSGDDEIVIRFPVPDLASTAAILQNTVQAMPEETSVGQACRVPKGFSCGEITEEPGFVMMIFDQPHPSRVAYLVSAEQAKVIGTGLTKAGRKAAEARSRVEIVQPAPAAPLTVGEKVKAMWDTIDAEGHAKQLKRDREKG